MTVVDGYGEYVFADHVDGAYQAPSQPRFELAYRLAHASSPHALVHAGRAAIAASRDDPREAEQRAIQTLQLALANRHAAIRGGLRDGLVPIFVPRTLYELIYLNEIVRQERDVAYRDWPVKPLPRWEDLQGPEGDHAAPGLALRPATLALAYALNTVIVRCLNQLDQALRLALPLVRRAIAQLLDRELARFNEQLRRNVPFVHRYPCPGVLEGMTLGPRLRARQVGLQHGTMATSMRAAVAIELAYPGRQLLYRASEFRDDVAAAPSVLSYNTGFWATVIYDQFMNTSTPEFLLQDGRRIGRCVAAPYADMLRASFPFHVPLGGALDQLHGIDQQSHAWSKANPTWARQQIPDLDLANPPNHWRHMIYAIDDRAALDRKLQSYPRCRWHPAPDAAPVYEAVAPEPPPVLAPPPPLTVRRAESRAALGGVSPRSAVAVPSRSARALEIDVDPELDLRGSYENDDPWAPAPRVPQPSGAPGRTAIEKLWAHYHCTDEESKVVTTDVYLHLLVDLVEALGVGLILYGSAALWLEGTPRPDDTPVLNIKDLDMAMDYELLVQSSGRRLEVNHASALEILTAKLRAIPAIRVITEDAPDTIVMTSAGTVEIMSPDKKIQFSVNWKTTVDHAALQAMCHLHDVHPRSGQRSARMNISGLVYIQHRLLEADGPINRTLFRPDKTAKIITYVAMCIASDPHQLVPMMSFVEALIHSRMLYYELNRLHIIRLRPQQPSAAQRGSNDEVGVVFHTLVASLQRLDAAIAEQSGRTRPEGWRSRYGVPAAWLDGLAPTLQEGNEQAFRVRPSESQLDTLREQIPRRLPRGDRFLRNFREQRVAQYIEEAQVGVKIYVLDYIFYNTELVGACPWADATFKRRVLDALAAMASHMAKAIQVQVNQSAHAS